MNTGPSSKVRVRDPLVRVFHWGLVGSRYARFAQFLKGPVETLAYLGDMTRGRERRYLGHNPAGAPW